MNEKRCPECSRFLLKIFTTGEFQDCEVCARDKTIAERDTEIERLKTERDHHEEYAKSAKRESTFWYNKSEWDRWKLYKTKYDNKKREAALLAFVEADDLLEGLKLNQQIGMMSWEWEILQEQIDQAEIAKAEARERLREVMDAS